MESWVSIFDLPTKEREVEELEALVARPDLWDDQAEAQRKLQRLNELKHAIEPWRTLESQVRDVRDLAEMVEDEEGDDAAALTEELTQADAKLRELELLTMMSGEHDSASAIIELNAGAGGTEACDWVGMLMRMYLRWAERRGYGSEVLDTLPGEQAGVKNATVLIEGFNAFGNLKSEGGVHRLVRISPFDANKRRHTTFASVSVLPDIEQSNEIQIDPSELRIDTYRASSAGGQHVNKTDSAVRITHLPTGIVVSCQNERSQHRNRDVAMKVLQARLWQISKDESVAKLNELRGDVRAIEWGNQIRSYVFQPYTLVKDHRTGVETGDVIRVMDGDIDDFVQGYLRWQQRKPE